ncbi:MAG: hypothetical protein HY063_01085 [Bacteroidetes bacterium]|nr:hypothetical protein [Bacteroidota bacterium]
MENRADIYKNYFAEYNGENPVTISDLKAKEFRDEKLSEDEAQSILNFDRFRLNELNKIKNDFEFNARFCELQIMANLADYKEFLKEEYFFSELL